MYALNDIKTLHIEMTEKCQADCPFCARTGNSLLTNAEITLDKAREYFNKTFIKQLNRMYMCGNYGDPIIARDTLEVFELFRYTNVDMILDMHTNGGARSVDWWKDLAYVLHDQRSRVVFSFDGLSDTNHIYRKNVNWDIGMQSAEAFIKAGGNAVWSFIVFRHNEHQIEEARTLSKKMGFKDFIIKKSARFATYNSDNILPPINPEYKNENLKTNDLSGDQIDCMVANEKSIYVSARGQVFPCCWVGGILDPSSPSHEFYGSYDKVDLNKHSLDEIFRSGIFTKIEQSWSCNPMKTCTKICSKGKNFFKAQYQ